MSHAEILKEILLLNPKDKFLMVETLLKSLYKPDETIDEIWADEALRRFENYKNENTQTIPFEDIFK